MSKKPVLFLVALIILVSAMCVPASLAWSNGGYSADPLHPDYGTHDWIAEYALDWLPTPEKQLFLDNKEAYLYGTELPDNNQSPDGIGDTTKHHIYYNSNRVMIDDAAAVRASATYNLALQYLRNRDFSNAAKNAGIMAHYVADIAVFSHVMGASTEWGAERHHSDYEGYVESRTSTYQSAEFNPYLVFGGTLDTVSAYDAARNLAYDTTFDTSGNNQTCVWMDQNYNWSKPSFKSRCGDSLNHAVNALTDVLHSLIKEGLTLTFNVIWESNAYSASVFTNAVPQNLVFSQPQKQITFTLLLPANATSWFCNVTFPKALLGGPYTVKVNDSLTSSTVTVNATCVASYFTHNVSPANITVTGAVAIPEFSSLKVISLSMLIFVTALVLSYRRSKIDE